MSAVATAETTSAYEATPAYEGPPAHEATSVTSIIAPIGPSVSVTRSPKTIDPDAIRIIVTRSPIVARTRIRRSVDYRRRWSIISRAHANADAYSNTRRCVGWAGRK